MANAMMKVGGIGCIIWLVCMIILIAMMALLPSLVGTMGAAQAAAWAMLALVIVMCVGILLASIGGFGLWKQYAHALPLIGGIMGLISAILLIVGIIVLLVSPIAILSWGLWIFLIAGVILSIFLLLIGISFIMLRTVIGTELALPTGVLWIIGGVGAVGADPSGFVTGTTTATTVIGGAFIGLFAMLLAAMWIFFKGR